MFSILQASKCAETCIEKASNCTNNYDVQVVGTICFYTMIIVMIIATIYGIIKCASLWYTYKSEKLKSCNKGESNENKLTHEEKERIAFYDFCFAMAKSTKPEEKELSEKCWEVLKNKYAPIISKNQNDNE